MKLKQDYKFIVGCDYINDLGERQTCIQLVNEEEKAIWIGDFKDGEVERIDAIKELFDLKNDILKECETILFQNEPQIFGKG